MKEKIAIIYCQYNTNHLSGRGHIPLSICASSWFSPSESSLSPPSPLPWNEIWKRETAGQVPHVILPGKLTPYIGSCGKLRNNCESSFQVHQLQHSQQNKPLSATHASSTVDFQQKQTININESILCSFLQYR